MVADPRSAAELAAPLDLLPPVEFCCVYGSSLLPNNDDKVHSSSSPSISSIPYLISTSFGSPYTSMVHYILGVADPIAWHTENLERNRCHYSKWMARHSPSAITRVADEIGVGVHFNPFVAWRDKLIKYGVVRMHDFGYGYIDIG